MHAARGSERPPPPSRLEAVSARSRGSGRPGVTSRPESVACGPAHVPLLVWVFASLNPIIPFYRNPGIVTTLTLSS